jgi:hypothetical protein
MVPFILIFLLCALVNSVVLMYVTWAILVWITFSLKLLTYVSLDLGLRLKNKLSNATQTTDLGTQMNLPHSDQPSLTGRGWVVSDEG